MTQRKKNRIIAAIRRIGTQEGRSADLERRVANAFSMSVCTFWVLYFLASSEDGLLQRDIVALNLSPKQTVNAAVAKMAADGIVRLVSVPQERRCKKIILTDAGRRKANDTVAKILNVEIKVMDKFGIEKAELLCNLRDEYYEVLESEIESIL